MTRFFSSQFSSQPGASDGSPRPRAGSRVLLILVVLAAVLAWWVFHDHLSLTSLARQEAAFRQYRQANPVLIYLMAFLVYVGVTGLSLPGAAAMTLLFAWLFGFWRSLVLVSVASTAGATLAFLLSRYLFRESVNRRFGDRLSGFMQSLQTEGAFYLFTLRLIPAVPFFVINAVMGLTSLSATTFWWVSQLGMLPGTLLYVYAGSRVPSLHELADKGVNAVFSASQITQILLGFVLLGLFPLVMRKLFSRFGQGAAKND